MSRASSIIIEEKTGLRRTLILRGAGLPFQGANWGGEQRLATTWYPGNSDEATQTVLGPKEAPSDFDGKWRTNQLTRKPCSYSADGGDAIPISRAFTLAELLESILRSGSLLRVTWSSETFDVAGHDPSQPYNENTLKNTARLITREGRAPEWDFSFDRADDIDWSISWEWIGRGKRQQKVVNIRKAGQIAGGLIGTSIAGEAVVENAALAASITSRRETPLSADRFTLGQLENFADGPFELVRDFTRKAQQITDRLKRIGDFVNRLRVMPDEIQNQIIDAASNSMSAANNLIDQLSRTSPESHSKDIKLAALTRSASYFADRITDARKLAREAAKMRRQAQQASTSKVTTLGLHRAIEGETFASMAQKFYKSPDQGPAIAKANALPLNQLEVDPGTLLIIPTLETIKSWTANV